MCLTKVYDNACSENKNLKSGTGFKIVTEGERDKEFRSYYRNTAYIKNRWYSVSIDNESDVFIATHPKILESDSGIEYPNGFHLYSLLSDAKQAWERCNNIDAIIVAVEWTDLLARGENYWQNLVFVVKRLKVLYKVDFYED